VIIVVAEQALLLGPLTQIVEINCGFPRDEVTLHPLHELRGSQRAQVLWAL